MQLSVSSMLALVTGDDASTSPLTTTWTVLVPGSITTSARSSSTCAFRLLWIYIYSYTRTSTVLVPGTTVLVVLTGSTGSTAGSTSTITTSSTRELPSTSTTVPVVQVYWRSEQTLFLQWWVQSGISSHSLTTGGTTSTCAPVIIIIILAILHLLVVVVVVVVVVQLLVPVSLVVMKLLRTLLFMKSWKLFTTCTRDP
jgi:hypothetical protein